ncbi:MAG: hypothetical protein HF311_13810, partial [Ignavibacteria bacterium]|nr:hypothetical protein [Ignavibacteria bacterium]
AGELLADGSYNTLYDALTPLPEASKAYAMATGTPIQNSTRVVGSSSTP